MTEISSINTEIILMQYTIHNRVNDEILQDRSVTRRKETKRCYTEALVNRSA